MYIIGAKRTPIGRFLSSLASFKASELGAVAIKGALEQAGIPKEKVDGVIMGHVCPAGLGQAPARQAQIKAGLPPEIPSLTVNKVCGSGLISVVLACQAIKAGDAKVMISGGQESMSNVPYYLHGLRTGVRMGEIKLVDGMIYDGIWCPFEDVHMGILAEFTAEKSGITREMQDKFAYESHMKAVKATKEGRFNEEIIPITVPQKKGEPIVVKEDEGPRPDTSLEKLAQLRPAFKPDGTITAGNASQISDGAAAVIVASEEFVKEYKLKPLAKIVAYAVGSVEPKMLFYAPVKAIRKILDILKVNIDYFDLIEINEAFAAQVLADGKELNWDWNKVNVKGGGVALGHPIGASGTRILVTLIYALKEIKKTKGLAAICLGGGEAVAMAIEVIS